MKIRTTYFVLLCIGIFSNNKVKSHPGRVTRNPDDDTSSDESLDQQQQQQIEDIPIFQSSIDLNSTTNRQFSPRRKQLQITDPCLEPKNEGKCEAYIPRYYLNTETGVCEFFIYGGCGGNGNNFESLPKCESRCLAHLRRNQLSTPTTTNSNIESATVKVIGESNVEEVCELEPATGKSCHAYLPRWTYNSTQGKCVQFIYKGCGATGNLFINKYKCEQKCGDYKRRKLEMEQQQTILSSDLEELSTPTIVPILLRNNKEACDQPLDSGHCFGLTTRYYYNKENSRCQSFLYGGCGGNDNNFMNAQDCMRNCGGMGKTPSTNIACSKVACPWNLYTHYTSMGCSPIYDGDSCCPTRFECSVPNVESNESQPLKIQESESTASNLKCHYKGKLYPVGSDVPEASSESACRAACTCLEEVNDEGNSKARISCAMIECPEDLGALPPGKENCKKLYKKGSCCAYDFHCENATDTTFTPPRIDETFRQQRTETNVPVKCHYEGKDYVEGERIYEKVDKCQTCLCQKGFNGTLASEFCEPIDCGIEIYYSDSLQRGCVPVYFENANGNSNCCPIGWECPETSSETNISRNEAETTTRIPSYPSMISVDQPQFLKVDRLVTSEACSLPRQVGPCKASRKRYFYNNTTQQCEQFTYGGCKGNKNNFVNLKDCQNVCETKVEESETRSFTRTGSSPQSQIIELSEVDPCTQERKTGVCKGYFPRFYFSPEENKCLPFIYGGCRGNRNNFYSTEACEAVCQNKIPVEESLKPRSGDNIVIISSNQQVGESDGDTQQSILPDLSHLQVVDITNTDNLTVEQDPCSLPPQTGRCKGLFPRFYYDPTVQYCKQFNYGGCGGNSNNFERLRDCDSRCAPNKGNGLPGVSSKWRMLSSPPQEKEQKPRITLQIERCNLPKTIGPCRASVPSYYYGVISGKCEQFLYGGCFGNANRFTTLTDCETTCKIGENLTEARFPKFLETDATTMRTISMNSEDSDEEGIPSSVTGIRRQIISSSRSDYDDEVPNGRVNPGNPETKENFCSMSPEVGSCRGRMLRFYWHSEMKQCLPFVYGGCEGNSNNFLSESDCLSRCGAQPTFEEITNKGVLSCNFGNETIPVGGRLGGAGSPGENSCGSPICQCITPPALTCVQRQCPSPIVPIIQEEERKPPCPAPNCGPHCRPSINPDNGCPTCDCDNRTNSQGFVIELSVIDESQEEKETEKVKGR